MTIKIGVGFAASQPAPQVIDAARLAERLGFDVFWVTDSHLIGREALTMLGALAVSTSTIELGPGVSHLAGRHPSVLASSMATLHERSHCDSASRLPATRSRFTSQRQASACSASPAASPTVPC